ncbi:MAG: DUF6472 family protein [Anaerostipes sp.]|jgi:hypothetical protein|nr:DUF6472 family protein [Anaerostipes sp.]MDD3747513.1 DUF6472 family protein [Anaerostipes sp.]
MGNSTNCDTCSNYMFDDEYGGYVCDINLDEDEMMRFMTQSDYTCPYYQLEDEYKIVRKQM